jgi:predicted lipoprotein with Yx(FWY)xxD motif
MRRKTTLLMLPALAVAIVALVIAGCGGGGNSVTASPASTNAKSTTSSGATVGVRSGKIGTFLVDSQGQTLYLFEKDTGKMSTCSGACASEWPPSTTSGQPKAGSGVKASLLGTTTRSDGTKQLTYAGHPLYRYAGDQAPGDTNGQGLNDFGGGWDVIAPSGKKIEGDHETSSSTSSSSSSSSNGGGNGW